MNDELMAELTSCGLLHRAFERVAKNGGCRGCDGQDLGGFRARLDYELDDLANSLARRVYCPLPLMRFAVGKPNGGQRWLSVPTVRDRVAQSAVYLLCRERFEASFEDSSFAYRTGRSVRDAVLRVRDLRDRGFRWVVDADIDDFFDSVDHRLLMGRVKELSLHPYLETLIELWVCAEVYDGTSIWQLKAGLPQGSVVSPMLSNLFLDRFDEELMRRGQQAVRYGDDFILLCRDEPAAETALGVADELLAELELLLEPTKTSVTNFERGFRFLGALFVGDAIYRPFDTAKRERRRPSLPQALGLRRYIELRSVASKESSI